MIRAAAKNHGSVAVVVDPADYPKIVEEIKAEGAVTAKTRLALETVARRDAAVNGIADRASAERSVHSGNW